jgi:putative SOS response-associated peptidase YedK
MCYFFSQAEELIKIQKRFNVDAINDLKYQPREKIIGFEFPEVPIITSESPTLLQNYKWGLIPFWVKEKETAMKLRQMTLNARAETLFVKPAFKDSILKRRCIIPTIGFYEWQHIGKEKIPYFIHLVNDEIFAFGGICDTWVNRQTGEIQNTFSIITTEANELMAEIHNSKKRMPLILHKENEKDWLDNKLKINEVAELLQPYNSNLMKAEKIVKF